MIDQRILLPSAPAIPGLVARPFDPGRDYPALAELMGIANQADGVEFILGAEALRVDFEHLAEFDPRRDVLLVEIDGALVAAAQTNVRTRDGMAVHHVDGWVRPDVRRQGIGRALLHWTERRSAEVARVDGRTGARVTTSWPDADQAGAIALYEGEGYEIIRYGFTMVRDLADPIPDAPLPAGLEVRPVVAADHRRIWDADVEAFQDHWGRSEPLESDYERWFAIPENDPGTWQVAWDRGEVAGSVMPFVYPDENRTLGLSRGWLEHISVRRPWRRRGLASALIVRALRDFRERGLAEAALGVDAENPTGAVALYEALGFHRTRTGIAYRKPLVVDDAAG
ncbi:MAG TPA: GNAT family N-acetyltransferase [Candidatus Limnocylindrales bacterium]|nr:GNAT family N-acetyltransferase [Candidatus Limnocylindrales bacterium]